MHRPSCTSLIRVATALLAGIALTLHSGAADAGTCGQIEFSDGAISTGAALPAVIPLSDDTRACLVAVAREMSNQPYIRSLTVVVQVPDEQRLDKKDMAIGEAVKQVLVEGGARKGRVSVVSQAMGAKKSPIIALRYRERSAGRSIAKVVELKGGASHGPRLQALQPTETGTRLRKQDYLENQVDTRAITDLPDGSQLRVEPSSLVRFRKVTMSADYKRQVEIEVVKGTVNTVATHQDGASFRLVTKSAAVSVKGTRFRTSVSDDGTTRIEVQDGEVGVGNDLGSVDVGAGQGTMVRPGEAPFAPRDLLPMAVGQRPLRGAFARPPELSWQPVPGAVGYIVEFAGNAEFTRQVTSAQAPADSARITPSAQLGPQKWFWRVQAVDADGFIGMPSKIFTFDVSGP